MHAAHAQPNERARPQAGPRAADGTTAEEAARKFEGLLIQQLLSVLRKTAPSGGLMGDDSSGEMYVQMFDSAIADQLAEGNGLGMREMLTGQLGGTTEGAAQTTGTRHSLEPRSFALPQVAGGGGPFVPSGPIPGGATGRLAQAASAIVSASPERWGREGDLGPTDLASDLATPARDGGVARFNVRDAQGYEGYYKCNLFAFEVARRAGFEVPVVGRLRGWGFPTPNGITADAGADGRVRGDWARVVTGENAEALQSSIQRGERALMLTASARGEHAGHMAVVERVHQIDYGSDGEVRRIVFDGWEARARGAQHLVRRTWNLYGNPGGNQPRNGFERIEILALRRPPRGARLEVPLSTPAAGSLRDAGSNDSASSSHGNRPNGSSEEIR